MDVLAYNRHAWNQQVEKGNRWTVPVGSEEIAAARRGDWRVLLTPTQPVPCDWFPELAGLGRGVKGLRLGRLPDSECGGVDAEVLAAYDQSMRLLGDMGAEIVELTLPRSLLELGALNGQIMSAEAYAVLAELVDDDAQTLDQDVRPRGRAGAAISSRDYLIALAERERMKASFSAAQQPLKRPRARWSSKCTRKERRS